MNSIISALRFFFTSTTERLSRSPMALACAWPRVAAIKVAAIDSERMLPSEVEDSAHNKAAVYNLLSTRRPRQC